MIKSIDKSVIRISKQKDDMKASFDLLIRILYHTAFICLSLYFFETQNYIISILCAIPHWMTYSFMGTAGISHELFHNSVFSNNKINKFFFTFFMILNWENYNYFKSTHWLHHKITLDEDDPKSLFKDKITFVYLLQLITFDFKGFVTKLKYTIQNAFGIFPNKKVSHLFPVNSVERRDVIFTSRIILIIHLITIITFILLNKWWLIFLINLSPFILSFFNRFLGFAQHYGLSSAHHSDYYDNCRTIILSKFWSFFYSNMNYHIEHHMYPYIPYYHIPKIHDELKRNKEYKNLSIGWVELVKELRQKQIFSFI